MKSLADLAAIREKMKAQVGLRREHENFISVVVGMGTCGIAAGARDVLAAFVEEAAKEDLGKVIVTQSGCIGLCACEPVVEVTIPGQEKVTYVNVTAEKAREIMERHIRGGEAVTAYMADAANN